MNAVTVATLIIQLVTLVMRRTSTGADPAGRLHRHRYRGASPDLPSGGPDAGCCGTDHCASSCKINTGHPASGCGLIGM